jgi:serine/threonine-protein kinase RIO1
MASPKEILLSANVVIQKYGEKAEKYAAKMLKDFELKEDIQAAAAWYRILQDIKKLKNQSPPSQLN